MATTTKTILLVDDEEKLLNSIAQRLDLMGVDAIKAKSGLEAIEAARKNRIDLAVVDLKMPGMDGLVTIAKLKEIQPSLRTVLLTGYGEEKIRQAAEALDSAYFEKDHMTGLWDFIKKFNADGKVIVIRPSGKKNKGQFGEGEFFFNGGQIEILPGQTSASESARFYQQYDKDKESSKAGRIRLIGETAEMRELRKNIRRSASLDCNVIIRGETGTGKELAARAIHELSSRKTKPFLAINCGCLTNELLFEELFGNGMPSSKKAGGEKNALSAVKSGGTLLLDQIEDMHRQMQLQLLRMIDQNDGSDMGAGRISSTDVRIIAAVSSNIKRLVDENKFRKDLFYRLNVFELSIPPLRKRGDDIPVISAYFLDLFAREFDKKVRYFSDEVMSAFMSYDFPGNVRELKHIIERAVILADGKTIERKHLPERFQQRKKPSEELKTENADQFVTLAEMENKYILRVLEACDGNKTRTAETLGISRAALWRKLKQINEDR
jgi:DNA-binding NtrC family response regulator